jgi:hypothetical protein
MLITNSPGLSFNATAVANDTESKFQSGVQFEDLIAGSNGSSNAQAIQGKFQYTEVEVAGDNSLFTPGDPGAPDAGKQVFDNALQNFLQLAQLDAQGGNGSASAQAPDFYSTSGSFIGANSAITWSGAFSLGSVDKTS